MPYPPPLRPRGAPPITGTPPRAIPAPPPTPTGRTPADFPIRTLHIDAVKFLGGVIFRRLPLGFCRWIICYSALDVDGGVPDLGSSGGTVYWQLDDGPIMRLGLGLSVRVAQGFNFLSLENSNPLSGGFAIDFYFGANMEDEILYPQTGNLSSWDDAASVPSSKL